MACGGCGRARATKNYSVTGGNKYLTDRQLKARLERYKRIYCKECETRYECDFAAYKSCGKRPQ
jgi:hypothetical protein